MISDLFIVESAPSTDIPPLKVANCVNVDVVVAPNVPLTKTLPELLRPVEVIKPVELTLQVEAVNDPSGWIATWSLPASPRVKLPACVNSRDFTGFNVAIDRPNPVPWVIPKPPTGPKINVSASSYAWPPV